MASYPVSLRPVTQLDHPKLTAWHQDPEVQRFLGDGAWMKQIAQQESRHSRLLVAFVEKKARAVVGVQYDPKGNCATLSLLVDPEQTRQGWAGHVLDILTTSPLYPDTTWHGWVHEDNQPALGLLAARGWEVSPAEDDMLHFQS